MLRYSYCVDSVRWQAHRHPLCGHLRCGKFREPYTSSCSLLPVFSLLVRMSGPHGAYWPSKEHEDGRQVALKTTHWTNREDTSPKNDNSPATCSSSRQTSALTAKVDNRHRNLRRQPSMNNLTLKEYSIGSLISSSPRLCNDSRFERLDPKGCPPLGRKSYPSYCILIVYFGPTSQHCVF